MFLSVLWTIAYIILSKLREMRLSVMANALASVLGVRIRQDQQKRQSKFYTLPRPKKSRSPEKSSEKRLKKPWVKVQVHRICQSPFWHLFVTPLKMGAKSPEVVETSRLFALISFLVQLDGKLHQLRYQRFS